MAGEHTPTLIIMKWHFQSISFLVNNSKIFTEMDGDDMLLVSLSISMGVEFTS